MENTVSHHDKLSPGYFFLSIGTLISLIASVASFLNLIFETLNSQFPDALNATYQYGYASYTYDSARTALATLIIFVPVHLIILYFWTRASKRSLGRIDEIIRTWMIYLILFIASLIVVIDLVSLVRYFVSGEITTRFIIKVVSTLVTAVTVGSYYIFELRFSLSVWKSRIYTFACIAVTIASIVWSFSVIGTPNQQRAWRLDEQRIQDLQSLQGQVLTYWQQKEKLPTNLAELTNPISGSSIPRDPQFQEGRTYEYKTTGDMSFELCATFTSSLPEGWQENSFGDTYPTMKEMSVTYPHGIRTGESWKHDIGRTCFERTIDPDMYPPYSKSRN